MHFTYSFMQVIGNSHHISGCSEKFRFDADYTETGSKTTSTYANAEATFSVVKLSKNTGIPIFSTKLLSSFHLPIEKIRKS